MLPFRKQIRTVHLVLTFALGLLAASAGLSGGVLVFRDEIDRATNPELFRVTPGEVRAPLARVLDAVERAVPGGTVGLVDFPRDAADPYEFWVQSAERPGVTGIHLVYVDPSTAAVLGSRLAVRTPMLVLLYWHSEFLVGGRIGAALAGLSGAAVLVLSVTGVYLWWPGRKKIRQALVVKRGASWKRVLHDLHRAGGFYLLPLFLLLATTGLALAFHEQSEAWLNRVTSSPPEPEPPVVHPPSAEARPLAMDSLARIGEGVLSGASTTRLMPPRAPTDPFIVRKKFPAERHPNGKSFVILDPYTGSVLAVRDASRAPLGWRTFDLLYPLHKGALGGIWTRIAHALAGVGLAALYVTGLLLWWKRTRSRPPGGRRGRPAERPDRAGARRGPGVIAG